MKILLYLFVFLASFVVQAQYEADKEITLSEKQDDDVYLAGETIKIDAQVNGDAVLAGANIKVRDTINQDLIVAGGDINVKGYINDDIRAAGGELIIDTNVGDDVIIFGGEVLITKDAVINGNLIVFSGDVEMNGTVNGNMKAYGGKLAINGVIKENIELQSDELVFNGEVTGTTKMVAEDITIGEKAKFFKDVDYWSKSGKVDFKESLINATANFNEDLAEDQKEFPYYFFGIAALGIWIFYLLSAFLIILILNGLLKNFWIKTAKNIDNNLPKGLGYGLVYLFIAPLIIIISFIILIGVPIGLLLGAIYLFSIVIGHIVLALLITYYINNKKRRNWGFWMLSFVALGIAMLLRLVTLIPFLGVLISILIIALAYGFISITIFKKNNIEPDPSLN